MLTELFMNTEEVDFCKYFSFSICSQRYRDARNESIKFFLFTTSNTNDPFRIVSKRCKSPFQKFNGIVKSKISSFIFNIMVS